MDTFELPWSMELENNYQPLSAAGMVNASETAGLIDHPVPRMHQGLSSAPSHYFQEEHGQMHRQQSQDINAIRPSIAGETGHGHNQTYQSTPQASEENHLLLSILLHSDIGRYAAAACKYLQLTPELWCALYTPHTPSAAQALLSQTLSRIYGNLPAGLWASLVALRNDAQFEQCQKQIVQAVEATSTGRSRSKSRGDLRSPNQPTIAGVKRRATARYEYVCPDEKCTHIPFVNQGNYVNHMNLCHPNYPQHDPLTSRRRASSLRQGAWEESISSIAGLSGRPSYTMERSTDLVNPSAVMPTASPRVPEDLQQIGSIHSPICESGLSFGMFKEALASSRAEGSDGGVMVSDGPGSGLVGQERRTGWPVQWLAYM
ncbi:hypothetical protein A1O1_06541 [Capronia coronata CBS 617.96]|uniref:Uncharacterized protein n=1 Tax=Capronia coronata CBS 617.96 TaxID=1182541 RepID=W9YA82_9EURO|nr:uncharacterized protein A1O1_06541 [Capronia coronata CBS 617.96]EXJ86171.1 hypothetical protein A1O1_06541 [Capronia coronata CBS 617.96]